MKPRETRYYSAVINGVNSDDSSDDWESEGSHSFIHSFIHSFAPTPHQTRLKESRSNHNNIQVPIVSFNTPPPTPIVNIHKSSHLRSFLSRLTSIGNLRCLQLVLTIPTFQGKYLFIPSFSLCIRSRNWCVNGNDCFAIMDQLLREIPRRPLFHPPLRLYLFRDWVLHHPPLLANDRSISFRSTFFTILVLVFTHRIFQRHKR